MNGDARIDRAMARALTPCGRTRREFLWEAGGGFVGTALLTLLAEDGFFARSAGAADAGRRSESPLAAQGAPFSGQGQGVHRPLHVRRCQPGRHVRPQARAHPVERQADPDPGQRPGPEGPQSRDAPGLVAQVRPARSGRDDGLRPVSAPGAVRGRRGGHPQHVHRQLCARLGPPPDEHGLSAPGIPEPGLVGDVWAGDGQPEPAGLRRACSTSAAGRSPALPTGARASCRRPIRGRSFAPAATRS